MLKIIEERDEDAAEIKRVGQALDESYSRAKGQCLTAEGEV